MVTLLYLEKELANGLLIVKINMPELNLQGEQIVDVTNLISLEELPAIVKEKKEELSNILFDRLVILIDAEENFKIMFDELVDSISNELKELRQKQFDE